MSTNRGAGLPAAAHAPAPAAAQPLHTMILALKPNDVAAMQAELIRQQIHVRSFGAAFAKVALIALSPVNPLLERLFPAERFQWIRRHEGATP